jgi:hypothetical protein
MTVAIVFGFWTVLLFLFLVGCKRWGDMMEAYDKATGDTE